MHREVKIVEQPPVGVDPGARLLVAIVGVHGERGRLDRHRGDRAQIAEVADAVERERIEAIEVAPDPEEHGIEPRAAVQRDIAAHAVSPAVGVRGGEVLVIAERVARLEAQAGGEPEAGPVLEDRHDRDHVIARIEDPVVPVVELIPIVDVDEAAERQRDQLEQLLRYPQRAARDLGAGGSLCLIVRDEAALVAGYGRGRSGARDRE